MTKAARRTFHSLRYRNYRLFFAGQAISQTRSWMQRIALVWFILQLTHNDAFAAGLMAFAQFTPYMLLGLFAGVLADRLDARRTVIATQAAQLVSASTLAWLALGGFARPWILYLIAFVNGTVLVLDVPSRQQLTYRMVGREDLPNAIALNSTLFNASRIFGPAVAGAGFTAWSANSNASMQLAAPDRLRGRVIGLYFYAFNGTGAIAGLMTGWLCTVGGTELAFAVSGLIGLVAVGAAALALGWTPPVVRRRRAEQPQHA